eukprot:765610-Hanusia_phi.AAC.6
MAHRSWKSLSSSSILVHFFLLLAFLPPLLLPPPHDPPPLTPKQYPRLLSCHLRKRTDEAKERLRQDADEEVAAISKEVEEEVKGVCGGGDRGRRTQKRKLYTCPMLRRTCLTNFFALLSVPPSHQPQNPSEHRRRVGLAPARVITYSGSLLLLPSSSSLLPPVPPAKESALASCFSPS